MKLSGACHCRQIRYVLNWPENEPVPARRCGCSYCTRFSGIWTSNPDAKLSVRFAAGSPEQRYRFGTGTADFVFCRHCGVVVLALDDNSESIKAVVNINTLDPGQDINFKQSDSDFDGESTQARIQRRAVNWISSVEFQPGTNEA